MSKKFLYVYINDKLEGILTSDIQGGLIFEYDDNAKRKLSLSLPLEKKVYSTKECHGFFNGLLPENNETKKRIAAKYNINPNNDFSMLKAIGYDCPGAVSFFDRENNQELKEYYEKKGKKVSEEELEKFILELPQKPLGTGMNNLRLSLAGAQDKTAVILADNQIMFSDNYTPTTHILKPAVKNLQDTVDNEYICMKTAEKCGIRVPNTEIRYACHTKYFLIERFDRLNIEDKIKRIHQEDFCQASNIASAFKYEEDEGIGFKTCFDILRKTKKPAIYINEFINLMVFNYLILNNDAHGKNFSILHNDDGTIELAPAYDLLCTRVYPELSFKMAMEIGGYYDCEGIQPVHFEKMAREVGISYAQLKKLIKNQCESIPEAMVKVIDSIDNKIGKRILKLVQKNCSRNLKRFNSI